MASRTEPIVNTYTDLTRIFYLLLIKLSIYYRQMINNQTIQVILVELQEIRYANTQILSNTHYHPKKYIFLKWKTKNRREGRFTAHGFLYRNVNLLSNAVVNTEPLFVMALKQFSNHH